MINKRIIGAALSLFIATMAFGQGARSFKINEVVVNNQNGLIDEYGERSGWIEIANTAWGTNNLGSCYLTTDRKALDENLSVPERIKLMTLIPKGDERTKLIGQEHIVFFADEHANRGTLHLSFKLKQGESNFVALFDGNAKTLIDSITIPPLAENQSYARLYFGDTENYEWRILDENEVTPKAANKGKGGTADKVAEFRETDPYGIAMTFMAMTVVFGCLISLYIFFHIFGWVVMRLAELNRVRAVKAVKEQAAKATVLAKQGLETKGVDYETYMAVISLALHEYEENVHDVESNVLTIRIDDRSEWHQEVPRN